MSLPTGQGGRHGELIDDDPVLGATFDLYVARSFGRYLFAWLEDAGLEYGVQTVRST